MLKAYLIRPRSATDYFVDTVCFLAFVIALAYLFGKVYSLAGYAGHDFKFLWLAGEVWTQGINPYSDQYHAIGQQVGINGHVPEYWPYPPNWFIPATLLALADVNHSYFITNLINIAMILASSALVTAVMFPYLDVVGQRNAFIRFFARILESPLNVFFLHVFIIAVLQATGIALALGQTSILIYFGLSLLIYGTSKDNGVAAVLGFTIILLKPQLGVLFVGALLMIGAAHRALVSKAIMLSLLISIPAFLISPMAAFEWLSVVDAYDELLKVNTPQEMTGIRNLFFAASDVDFGNIIAMVIALVVMTILSVPVIRARSSAPEIGMGANESLCLIMLASAVTIAIAPLHIYDFTIVAVILFVLLKARSLEMVTGLIGFALILRADDVAKMAASYSFDTQYYGGSKLATAGAMMLLLAVFRIIMQQRAGETNQAITEHTGP